MNLSRISEKFVINKLKKITNGNLKLINYDGKVYHFGDLKSDLKTDIKVNNSNLVHIDQNISAKIVYPYKSLFVEMIFIVFRYLGFFYCLKAFSIGSLISQSELISSFSLAWIIGLVVPAAPGGLGVFESVILFGLGSHLPEAPLLASLLFYRLIATVADLFAALLYPVKRLFKV